eukprot:472553_1
MANSSVSSEPDMLVTLISIRKLASKCSLEEYTEILHDFMTKFGINEFNNILFSALYNTSNSDKSQWILFFNDKINELSLKENNENIDVSNECLLMNIHDDELTHICQYLTINDLVTVEQCNTFLFNKVRTSSYFITTLDYPSWLKYYKHINVWKIERFPFVKKLFLMAFSYKTVQYDALTPIINNITHLSIDNFNAMPNCDGFKIQSLTTFYTATDQIMIPTLFLPNTQCRFDWLIELKIYQMHPWMISDLIIKLLDLKLQTLEFYTDDKMNLYLHRDLNIQRQPPLSNKQIHIENFISNGATLWETLKRFVYDKGKVFSNSVYSDKVMIFVDKMIQMCKCLETLELRIRNIGRIDCQPTFYERFNPISMKHISLHLSSSKTKILLDKIIDKSPELQSIDLLLWDHISDEDILTYGSQILNSLRKLLIFQLSNGEKLRDIKLKFVSKFTKDAMYQQLSRLKLLYLMLISVFKN